MATYYKEGSKRAVTGVDFAGLGQDAIAGIDEVVDERQGKRDAIDASIAETKQKLSERPEGEHDGITSYWLDHTADAQVQMLEKENLLKRGKLSPRDFSVFNNNVIKGTEEVSGMMKGWQAAYGKKMERMNAGESGGTEQWDMENLEQYGNLDQSSLSIDEKTGVVSVLKKVKQEDGSWQIVDAPENRTSISNLGKRMGHTFDKYQADDILKEDVDKLGMYVEVLMKGNVSSFEDIKRSPEWGKKKDMFINSLMTNDENVLSVLVDSSIFDENGKQYGHTNNKEEAENDHSLIYMTRDPSTGRPTPHLEEWHKKAAKDYLTTRYESMIDEKEKVWKKTAPRQESAAQIRSKQQTKNAMGFIKGMDNMISGTESEAQAAAGNLKSGMNAYYDRKKMNIRVDDLFINDDGGHTLILNRNGESEEIVISGKNEDGSERPKRDVIEELYNYLAPTEGVSFSSAIDNYNRTEGGLSDRPSSGVKYSVEKPFVDRKPITTETQVNRNEVLGDKLSRQSANDAEAAAPVVKQMLDQAFDGMGVDVKVTDDSPYFGTNSVTISIDGREPVKIKYSDFNDVGSLKNAVNDEIKAVTKTYNEAKGQKKAKKKLKKVTW